MRVSFVRETIGQETDRSRVSQGIEAKETSRAPFSSGCLPAWAKTTRKECIEPRWMIAASGSFVITGGESPAMPLDSLWLVKAARIGKSEALRRVSVCGEHRGTNRITCTTGKDNLCRTRDRSGVDL